MSDEQMMAMLMGVGMAVYLIVLAVAVLEIVALWKIFTKAGEKGWKSLIPLYNTYTLVKISWQTMFFWIMLAVGLLLGLTQGSSNSFVAFLNVVLGLASFVLVILQMNKLAKAFGKGSGFTVGLVLLNPIFMMILAFGSAQYQAPAGSQAQTGKSI